MITDATSHAGRQPLVGGLYLLGPHSPRGWLAEALETVVSARFTIQETPALSVALERLHDEPFDVFIADTDAQPHPLPELVQSVRSQTHEHQPIVVLADGPDRQQAAACLEAGAAAFISMSTTTTRELAWHLRQAALAGQEARELQRLRSWQQRHDQRQQADVLRLVDEQVEIFSTAARLRGHQLPADSQRERSLPELTCQCRDFLKAYVVMGSGHLAADIQLFVDQLQQRQVPTARLLQAFSCALQQLIHDRGARSSRHIYDRGNLLLLDLLLKSADAPLPQNHHASLGHHSSL